MVDKFPSQSSACESLRTAEMLLSTKTTGFALPKSSRECIEKQPWKFIEGRKARRVTNRKRQRLACARLQYCRGIIPAHGGLEKLVAQVKGWARLCRRIQILASCREVGSRYCQCLQRRFSFMTCTSNVLSIHAALRIAAVRAQTV